MLHNAEEQHIYKLINFLKHFHNTFIPKLFGCNLMVILDYYVL